MSTTYNLEPQPTSKVVLHTTGGDISLSLFGKQTPLATRNFLQHCLDGTYTNTIFHRLVPGFILQGGDPTGTGAGGISAINDGRGFEDEFHSRLKFNRRGLLGMAKSEGEEGAYGSQFFMTLDKTPELQGVCTMFGRVEGDTIFNLVRMGEAELAEGSERPLYPTRITSAEVLVNPFEDMVAKVREAPRTAGEAGKKDLKKRKKPLGKNVLSFGGDDDGGDGAPAVKRVKANPKLLSAGMEEPDNMNTTKMPEAPAKESTSRAATKSAQVDRPSSTERPVQTQRTSPPKQSGRLPTKKRQEEDDHNDNDGDDDDDGENPNSVRLSVLDQTNAEIAALKASLKRTSAAAPRETSRPKSALEAMIPSSSTRGRKRGKPTDEKGAYDMFRAFKQRLEELPAETSSGAQTADGENSKANGHSALSTGTSRDVDGDEEAELCDLHFIANCQSCRSWDARAQGESGPAAEADEDDDVGWMNHALTFAKDTLGKDLEWKRKMEEIEVIDPLERAKSFKEEGSKAKGKV